MFQQGSAGVNQGFHVGFRDSDLFTCAFWADDLDTAATYTDSNWHKWTCTYDASTKARTIYRDGVIVASDTASNHFQGSGTFYLGLDGMVTEEFHGQLDEARVLNVALSSQWLQTEFNNQNNPGTFLSVGSQQHASNDIGSHSNFDNLRAQDGSYDTLSEYSPNTHSLYGGGAGEMLVGAGGSADFRSVQGTISFWLYHDSFVSSAQPWGQQTDFEFDDYNNAYRLDWGATGGDTLSPPNTTLVVDKWYFIAVTWNENTNEVAIYVGDENTAPWLDSYTNTWTSAVSTESMGTNTFLASGSPQFDGYGDDLRFWDTDRSITEIQSDYNTILNGDEPNLRNYYKLDGDFVDSGPDGNDGSSSGTTSFSTNRPGWPGHDLDMEVQRDQVPFNSDNEELKIYTGT
ncbi:MAG: LamG-like jellyroll fold domain-containing protein, partial [Candidatus Kariarchaeaceae archaeon]